MSEELKPFWSRYPFRIKPAALCLLLLSPIILLVLLVIEHSMWLIILTSAFVR